MGKWEILGIVDEGVNSETRILLQFWDFYGLTVDDAWSLLEWVVRDSFEFERLVVFIDIHFPIHVHFTLDLIMLRCGAICVVLLSIM